MATLPMPFLQALHRSFLISGKAFFADILNNLKDNSLFLFLEKIITYKVKKWFTDRLKKKYHSNF